MTPTALAAAVCIGAISHVVDGDTLDLACHGGDVLRVRLADVDAPEMRGCSRDLGRAAQAVVEYELGPGEDWPGELVAWSERRRDRYGRSVGDGVVLTGFFAGLDLTTAIVSAGERHGVETLRPWRHVGGRAVEPRPDWCGHD